MTYLGTRPPTLDEWEKYEPHHRARMSFRPGLTGLWQVSGRSNITDFEEVVKLDEMLSHLTGARSMDELHGAKIAVLRDFYSVCSFDIQDADFPEPIGHFDSENEKTALIRKKILLQDTVQYLGNI